MNETRLNGGPIKTRVSRNLVALLAIAAFCVPQPVLGQKKQKLEKSYREWLERDVTYIITKDEKDAFLRLTSNEARDKFIEDFWEIRNPNPGSTSNCDKDEIYQRIALADARVGIGCRRQGWHWC